MPNGRRDGEPEVVEGTDGDELAQLSPRGAYMKYARSGIGS